ncbi:MAG TPA: tetratricopeptide repeat protein [Ktedonobacteraceae bacterium]|nr:tetratricopeptide repeat protein [Ktedonobacteraceae bacterium]
MKKGNNGASLANRIHDLLKQKQMDEVRELLVQLPEETIRQKRELGYLRAWYAVAQSRWEDAAEYLCSPPFTRDASEKEALVSGYTERRRRPRFLLLLGSSAMELGYAEEAREHFLACLALLDERRMNVPELRLQAQYALGELALQTGWPDQAVLHYSTALSLCAKNDDPAFLVTLYSRLCEASYEAEDFTAALGWGHQGLEFLKTGTSLQSREDLLVLLAQVCLVMKKFKQAIDYAQEARQLADQIGNAPQKVSTRLTLAEIFLAEEQTSEARQYCQQALDLSPVPEQTLLRGKTLFLYGKVAEMEWREKPECTRLAEEAKSFYEEARTIFAALPGSTPLIDVLRQLALLLEQRGSSEQALAHWKTLYQLAEK